MKNFTLIELLIILLIIILITFSVCRGFLVSEDTAIKALENAGYSEIKITDRAVFFIMLRGGSRSDAIRFTAVCKNPVGKEVETYVFVGWPFKYATIRSK